MAAGAGDRAHRASAFHAWRRRPQTLAGELVVDAALGRGQRAAGDDGITTAADDLAPRSSPIGERVRMVCSWIGKASMSARRSTYPRPGL